MFRHNDVPLQKDASARFLPWLIGFMVYLATLALVGTLAVNNLAERWRTGLAGQLTVQVPPPENSDVGQDERVKGVVDALRQRPGIADAQPLSDARVQALLAPWLGTGQPLDELPLPALIAAEVNRANPPNLRNLQAAVETAAPGARLDDHQRTLGKLLDAVRSLQGVALAIMGLVTAAAVVTVVFAARMGLAVHNHVIEILHLIGAHDRYIAAQFERHALKLGLIGGMIGVLLGAVSILAVRHLLPIDQGTVIPTVELALWQWAGLALVPLISAALATATARLTVLRALARLG